MPIIDIVIAVAIAISVIVGIIRGFVKEAISIAALLVAIWAALFFGPSVGGISESWIASRDLQMWFGRILVFAVILSIGGLAVYCWPPCSSLAVNMPALITTTGGSARYLFRISSLSRSGSRSWRRKAMRSLFLNRR
jgi:hypothetical protein